MTKNPATALEERFARVSADGARSVLQRWIATETPVGIEINGLAYAVLLATPADLADLALGFALSERLIDRPGDVIAIDVFHRADDVLIRMTLTEPCAGRVHDRVRHRATDASCGLCGIESLEQAMRPLPPVTARSIADDAAVFRALGALAWAQPLNRRTRAVHGAAACSGDGAIRLVREDVGRHNAFDKLIGALAVDGLDWDGGFALLTSRCSCELVDKAVLAGCAMLVTISAPTSLALSRARGAGLRLKALARVDALLDMGET